MSGGNSHNQHNSNSSSNHTHGHSNHHQHSSSHHNHHHNQGASYNGHYSSSSSSSSHGHPPPSHPSHGYAPPPGQYNYAPPPQQYPHRGQHGSGYGVSQGQKANTHHQGGQYNSRQGADYNPSHPHPSHPQSSHQGSSSSVAPSSYSSTQHLAPPVPSEPQILEYPGKKLSIIEVLRLMKQFATDAKWPPTSTACSIVYYHRYQLRQREINQESPFSCEVIAAACLFLASKVEETLKKIDYIVEYFHMYLYQSKIEPEKQKSFVQAVVKAERVLIESMGFQFNVDMPYKHLFNSVKKIKNKDIVVKDIATKAVVVDRFQEIAKFSWGFLETSLISNIWLRYPTKLLAAAALYSGVGYLNCFIEPSDIANISDTTFEQVKHVGDQMLMYSKKVSALKKTQPQPQAQSQSQSQPSRPTPEGDQERRSSSQPDPQSQDVAMKVEAQPEHTLSSNATTAGTGHASSAESGAEADLGNPHDTRDRLKENRRRRAQAEEPY